MSQRDEHRDRITDEAALWFARAQDPDFAAADKKALADWLVGSAEHVREYLELAALTADISELSRAPSVDELIRMSRETDDGANVLPISSAAADTPPAMRAAGDPESSAQRRVPRRWSPRSWASAAIVIMAVGAASLYFLNLGALVYSTGLGEQRSVRLEDGSVVTLNAQSTLELAFTDKARNVRLLSGEVLFDVAKDPERPFQVLTERTTIRAVGTAFNVRHRGEDTTVTVVEGTVEVESSVEEASGQDTTVDSGRASLRPAGRAQAQPVRVTVGQQARVEPKSGQVAVVDANVSKATAWRQRRVVFDTWPLSKVVAEFNLYNDRPIVIASEALGARPISGAFDADDRESFALFLKEAGIAATKKKPDGTIELHRKGTLP